MGIVWGERGDLQASPAVPSREIRLAAFHAMERAPMTVKSTKDGKRYLLGREQGFIDEQGLLGSELILDLEPRDPLREPLPTPGAGGESATWFWTRA